MTSLKSEIKLYSKVFIVVDALDESPEDEGTRADLLVALQSLSGTVNLMVTSRDFSPIARHFPGATLIDIRANDEDVRSYVHGRIACVPRRHLVALQVTIANKIVENVKGMQVSVNSHDSSH